MKDKCAICGKKYNLKKVYSCACDKESPSATLCEECKRYDAKKGKKPPAGAIPCCEPDPVTGHWPHWVKVDGDNHADKWFIAAFENSTCPLSDGTFEAVGPHFQGNPYNYTSDLLLPHGDEKISVLRTFDGIRHYLMEHEIEGIVFWRGGEPRCKIKRSDFGFEWPVKGR